MRTWNIAHRGGAGLSPENTLLAFEVSGTYWCDGAELDVQLTRDGMVVVHHDYRLMADVARRDGVWLSAPGSRIKDLTLEQLQQFDVGCPRPGSCYALNHPLLKPMDGERIPTLAQVIDLARYIPQEFRLFVELKCDASGDSADPAALADAALDIVADEGFLDRTIFVGFDWRALARIRRRDPYAECWFTTDRLPGAAQAAIDAIAAAGGQGWFPNFQDATPENVAYARDKGLKVGAWTINAPADMRRLMDLDALCTDRPDLLSSLL
jgi:glycerophosphoryl diester phosphodiesterase